jgi:hypothetical protein
MMPVMDGITACRLLRGRIPSDLLPVIFLTAKTDPGAVATVFEAGGTDFCTKPLNRQEVVARTLCQGLASRRARARYFEAIPIATLILTKEPFWKMHPATGSKPMFVICFYAGSQVFDGPLLLHFFQLEKTTFESDWQFCEVGEHSVTFLASSTNLRQIRTFLSVILAGWAESRVVTSPSISSKPLGEDIKPLITIGVDYRPIRAHLFGERQPMLAAVENCGEEAHALARRGSVHEEMLLSDSAQDLLAGVEVRVRSSS